MNYIADEITANMGPTIQMSSPDITEAEMQMVNDVLGSGRLALGSKGADFESKFAKYIGTPFAVAVNSGTSGLHLAMIAAGIQEGDEVITPSFSFVASANCVLYERGKPIFVDVDARTGNLDPTAVESAVTTRTKAIIAVHAFGQPSDMDQIMTTAERHGLIVVEDACEAIGAEYKGRMAGTLGNTAVFAFYPNKQMTTGEGGMIVTDRKEWDGLFRSIRNQGRDVFDAWLNHSRLGYNYRLDEMSAALGLVQLRRIEDLLSRRHQVAGWYTELLADEELLQTPVILSTTSRMSWFVYVVRILAPASRDLVMTQLAERGIPTRPYFTPVHLQPFYRDRFGYQRGLLPTTERLGEISLALPFSGVMTKSEVEYVCSTIRCVVRESR